jgi:hypothetical protein
MAKKRQGGEDVLKDIIAKSTNKEAIAVAQSELSSLQERKAAVSAAIKPVLDVPQIVADPASSVLAGVGQKVVKGTTQTDENVVKNIKKIKEDISTLSEESKKSRKILESILKTNEKYFESNKELIDRLLMSNNSLMERLDASLIGSRGQAGGAGQQGVVTPQQQDNSSGLFGGLAGLGILGALGTGLWKGAKALTRAATSPFRKAPTPDVPKPKAPNPDLPKNKKVLDIMKKGGRAGALAAAFMAAGASAIWVAGYFSADDEAKAKMINDLFGYVPDWLEGFLTDSPDLAIMLGVQLPELAYNAYATFKPLVTGGIEGGKAAAAAAKPRIFPKGASGLEMKGVNEAAQGVWAQAAQNKTTVSSIANTAVDTTDELRSASKIKTGLTKAKSATKVTKEIIKGALAKKLKEDTARIAGKKVPLLSIGIGSAMAGARAYGGDYYGAGEELLSGLASLIPVVGTAVSLGLDADLLANDVYESIYGIRPDKEKDPMLKEQRWSEIRAMAYDVVKEQYDSISAQLKEAGSSLYDMLPDFDSENDNSSSFNAMGDFSPIGLETDPVVIPTPESSPKVSGPAPEMTPDEAQRTLMGSTNGPRTRDGIGIKLPLPKQKITQEQISNIGNPTGAGPGNVTINRQGDVINNVVQGGNAGSSGPSGVSGSPNRVPSPFDYLLYGDSFNWGY